MRIHFERSGGFAGPASKRSVTVDTESLPADEARELTRLAEAADVPRLAASSGSAAPPRPDMFTYKLTVESGEGRHAVELPENELPEAARPLVQWLKARANPGPAASS